MHDCGVVCPLELCAARSLPSFHVVHKQNKMMSRTTVLHDCSVVLF